MQLKLTCNWLQYLLSSVFVKFVFGNFSISVPLNRVSKLQEELILKAFKYKTLFKSKCLRIYLITII